MSGCRRDLKFGTELLEAARRQLGTACHKLQQSGHFLLSEVANDDPEPRDDSLEGGVTAGADHCMLLEVIVADCLCATYEKLCQGGRE